MSSDLIKDHPSTPPSSSPASPTDPRNVALLTPLKLSRARHPSFAPLTPQSLVAPQTPSFPKGKEQSIPSSTPSRKFRSNHTPSWPIHEEQSSNETSTHNADKLGRFLSRLIIIKHVLFPDGYYLAAYIPTPCADDQPAAPTTPSKPLAPVTPQGIKSMRNPLRSDMSNYSLSHDPHIRGSFTDPPPRRRAPQVQLRVSKVCLPSIHAHNLSLQDEAYPGPDLSDVNVTSAPRQTENATHAEVFTGSPLPGQVYPQAAPTCASCGGTERLSLLQPCQHQICASCVTGSLNVVGEKDMICMYCLSPIQSFKISRVPGRIHSETPRRLQSLPPHHQAWSPQDTFNSSPLYANRFPTTPNRPVLLADSPAAPPAPGSSNAVLRIDNVPWVSKRMLSVLLNAHSLAVFRTSRTSLLL